MNGIHEVTGSIPVSSTTSGRGESLRTVADLVVAAAARFLDAALAEAPPSPPRVVLDVPDAGPLVLACDAALPMAPPDAAAWSALAAACGASALEPGPPARFTFVPGADLAGAFASPEVLVALRELAASRPDAHLVVRLAPIHSRG